MSIKCWVSLVTWALPLLAVLCGVFFLPLKSVEIFDAASEGGRMSKTTVCAFGRDTGHKRAVGT